MRSTASVYVDVGYLLASAATRATGTSLRSGIHVEYRKLIDVLIETAAELSGLPLLRVHWYDSANKGVPDEKQERIGELPKVKLRLGRFGMGGEQKGVDLRIGLDLVNHARNAASDVFFLVSGDDDLTEAVEEAQAHGVQVVILAIPDATGKPHGISRHLLRAADESHTIDGERVDAAVMKIERQAPPAAPDTPTESPAAEETTDRTQTAPRPGPHPAAPKPGAVASNGARKPTPGTMRRQFPATAPSATLAYSSATGQSSQVMPGYDDEDDAREQLEPIVERVLTSFLDAAGSDQHRELAGDRPAIPREIDRALLIDASDALDVDDVPESTRYALRTIFWDLYDARR